MRLKRRVPGISATLVLASAIAWYTKPNFKPRPIVPKKSTVKKETTRPLVKEVARLWKKHKNKRYFVKKEEVEKELQKWNAGFLPEYIKRTNLKFNHAENKTWFFGAYIPTKHLILIPSVYASEGYLEKVFRLKNIDLQTLNKRSDLELNLLKSFLTFFQKNEHKFLDSIDHELSHATIDSSKGMLFDEKRYVGPSYQDFINSVRLDYTKQERSGHIDELAKLYLSKGELKRILKDHQTIGNFLASSPKPKKMPDFTNIPMSFTLVMYDPLACHRTLVTEVLARKVDSLMDVYLGPNTESHYRLREDELQLFDQVEYNGIKIFGEAVNKYRLGKKMYKKGTPWKEILKIQYKKRFSFDGKEYHWKGNKLRLKKIEIYKR